MRVTENMKIRDALAISEHMLDAFMWLAPEFERLQYPKLRRAMAAGSRSHKLPALRGSLSRKRSMF